MQILANIILYGFMLWLLYESLVVQLDPWFAVVVGFVMTVAVITTLMPGLHVSRPTPGEYPFEDH